MKKIMMILALSLGCIAAANAQTQKDWYLIGGNISNIRLGLDKSGNKFSFDLTPKVAWFWKDNLAVGAYANLGFNSVKSGTTTVNSFTYQVGPLARYYFKGNALNAVSKTRWFLEGNVGIAGDNITGTATNGLGVGFGPGIAYFINQNIALEGLAKYNYIAGFGNRGNSSNLNIGIGLQIYLPRAKVRELKNDVK